jgi:SAM-dependent methyltransferase
VIAGGRYDAPAKREHTRTNSEAGDFSRKEALMSSRVSGASGSLEPAGRMVELLNAQIVAQALYVAAQLGLADLVAGGATSIEAVAEATGAHGPSLHRLLRMLAGEGVFREVRSGEFALTSLGETLRSDSPSSVRDRALYLAAPEVWAACGELRQSIMTGEAAFERLHGAPFYAVMRRQPEVGAPFNRWMTRGSELDNAAVVASYDFSPFSVVVDVGGGHGATLAAILRAYPRVHGILLDLPKVVENAAVLESSDLAGRAEIVAGDMTQAVPPRGDAYVIKNVFRGEPDDRSVTVLSNCVDALAEGGRILVVDAVMPNGDEPSPSRAAHLLMLTCFGGRIRTACLG